MAPRTQRRHQQGEESRQRILDATIQIAAERGYEGTSISLVSRHSGLPASSIYWHFASKDLLLAAVIDRSFQRWLDGIPEWEDPAEGVSLLQHARAVSLHVAEGLRHNADFLRLGLMLSLERRPSEPQARVRFLESRAIAFDRQVRWFSECMRWAGVEPDPATCKKLATLRLAISDGLFIEAQIGGDETQAAELIELTSDLLTSCIERSPDPVLDGGPRQAATAVGKRR